MGTYNATGLHCGTGLQKPHFGHYHVSQVLADTPQSLWIAKLQWMVTGQLCKKARWLVRCLAKYLVICFMGFDEMLMMVCVTGVPKPALNADTMLTTCLTRCSEMLGMACFLISTEQ